MAKQVHLTPRQNQVLWWTCMGKTYEEIGIILGIKLITVKHHIERVMKKLGATNAKQAIYLATKEQLVIPDI